VNVAEAKSRHSMVRTWTSRIPALRQRTSVRDAGKMLGLRRFERRRYVRGMSSMTHHDDDRSEPVRCGFTASWGRELRSYASMLAMFLREEC
jgi:hypothetical protein